MTWIVSYACGCFDPCDGEPTKTEDGWYDALALLHACPTHGDTLAIGWGKNDDDGGTK